jgi:hypothetical protein
MVVVTGSLFVYNLRKAMEYLLLRLYEVIDLSRYLAAFILYSVSVKTLLTGTAFHCIFCTRKYTCFDSQGIILSVISQYLYKWVLYMVSREECKKLRESVPYVKVYRYNPKHLYPKLNGYGDNGQRSLKL